MSFALTANRGDAHRNSRMSRSVRRDSGLWLALVVLVNTASSAATTLSSQSVELLYTVSPSALAFGSETIDVASAAQSMTVTNIGTAMLPITSITLAGTNPGQFTQTNTCGTSVAVAGTCTISVVFKPYSIGSKTAILRIDAGSAPDANSVKLMDTLPTGLAYITSTGSPVLSGQLATWNLGNVVAGSSATIQLVTTANNCNTTFINSPLLTVGAPSSAVTAGPVTVQALCSPTPTPPAPGNKPYVYSNPSSGPTVQFVYNMADSGKADIRIWNASGVLAASLEDVKPSGIQQSTLNIQAFAPGHYFYQIDLKYDSGQEDRSPTQVLAVQK